MRISLGAMVMALLLTAAMAFAQGYESQPADQNQEFQSNTAVTDQSVVSDESVGFAPVEGARIEGQGVSVEGNAMAVNTEVTTEGEVTTGEAVEVGTAVEGVPAVHYEISEVGEQRGGSLLPDQPTDRVTGVLSSWDTSPTGVYKSAKDHLGSPFPLAAAPAINTGDRNLLPNQIEVPPSMAGNISSWDTAPTAAYKDYEVMVGSPFPMSADPSIRLGKDKMSDIDVGANFSRNSLFPDTESPMPTVGAPARRAWW